MPLPNRRAEARKALRVPATLVCREVSRQVRTLDVARDGICLCVARPIAPGSRCTVTFDVPLDDGPVTVTAALKTVYSSYSSADEFTIGGRFIELDARVAEILGRFAASA